MLLHQQLGRLNYNQSYDYSPSFPFKKSQIYIYPIGIHAHHCTIIRAGRAMDKAQPETPAAYSTRDGRKKKYKGKGRDVPKYIACSETLNILQLP